MKIILIKISFVLTTGASGGAIRKPWLIIPAKLVKRDPCLRYKNNFI